ncbi:hypothetical protein NL676_001136 [Syzygium grande]|nr:hypothetical protein NL676_001136 [Syzygium grande]
MGKEVMVSEASMKVSKNSEKKPHPHQQHLHSLIKVLKPKVYITDASSFKRLVQELTGNARSNPLVPSSPYSPSPSPNDRILTSCQETASEGTVQAQAPIPVYVEDQDHHHGDSRSTRAEFQVPTIESSHVMGNINHQQVGLVGLEELESWLLEDVDHLAVPFCESSYYYDHHQEVSIYDYGFSEML